MAEKRTLDYRLDTHLTINPSAENHKYASRSDEEIWDDFRKGDEGALVFMYRQYVKQLYNYGRQFCDDGDFVLDCIQELFFQLIRRRYKLGKTDSIKYYLYSSLRRLIWDRLSKESKTKKDESILTGSQFKINFSSKQVSLMEDPFDHEQKEILKRACNNLPARQKEAILLFFYEELSYKEIATIMQISDIKYARTLVYRALESLRDILHQFKDKVFFSAILMIVALMS